MHFQYDCTGVSETELEALEYLLDHSEPISADDFYDLVEPSPYLSRFENRVEKISEAPLIHCYRGTLPDGTTACYFDYSRIEHVFY